MPKMNTAPKHGIGEWYGKDFSNLTGPEIRQIAKEPPTDCPFRYPTGPCNKEGGVCSLRKYSMDNGSARPVDEELVTTCPKRFEEAGTIFSEIGMDLLGTNSPLVTPEIPFLISQSKSGSNKPVGKIDMILVNPATNPFDWCAVEVQAVYFSGGSLKEEIHAYQTLPDNATPFPAKHRRPDFRSSGPKRLMPQLQTKVPTIARWGKKTAVVIDKSFWNSLAPMEKVDNISNCDIVWYIVDYSHSGSRFTLQVYEKVFTTLNDAVLGLTGGTPMTRSDFEERIELKMPSGFRVQP